MTKRMVHLQKVTDQVLTIAAVFAKQHKGQVEK